MASTIELRQLTNLPVHDLRHALVLSALEFSSGLVLCVESQLIWVAKSADAVSDAVLQGQSEQFFSGQLRYSELQ